MSQELEDALPPLESEEYALEGEAIAESDSALWTPAFLSGSSNAFTDSLRQGHVYSAVDFAMLSASDEAFQFDGDSVLTPRFQLGWESESGFGVRGSYWNFEDKVAYSIWEREINSTLLPGIIEDGPQRPAFISPNEGNASESSLENFDLDVYQRFNAGESLVTFGGGIKSVNGQVQYMYDSGIVTFSENRLFAGLMGQHSVKGIGPSLFTEWRKPMFKGNRTQLAFFTAGRTSFVLADYEFRSSPGNPTNLDDELWINEANAGVELSRRYRQLVLRLRGQFETQLWSSSVMDNQALTGTSLSFGLDW